MLIPSPWDAIIPMIKIVVNLNLSRVLQVIAYNMTITTLSLQKQ
jgi:hypothetical protein